MYVSLLSGSRASGKIYACKFQACYGCKMIKITLINSSGPRVTARVIFDKLISLCVLQLLSKILRLRSRSGRSFSSQNSDLSSVNKMRLIYWPRDLRRMIVTAACTVHFISFMIHDKVVDIIHAASGNGRSSPRTPGPQRRAGLSSRPAAAQKRHPRWAPTPSLPPPPHRRRCHYRRR